MVKLHKQIFFVVLILLALTNGKAWATIVDLNTFVAAPGANILISSDGQTAAFSEDIFFSPVSLSNSNLAIQSSATILSFDYELVVPVGNEDYFDLYLGNTSSPLFSVGGFADPAVETNSLMWSDTYSVDLTAYAGSSVEMIFGFMYGWNDWGFDSLLTISNLQIDQKIVVSEPSSLALMGLGILGIFGIRRLAKQ